MISEQYKEGPDRDGSLELELGKFAKRKKLEQKSEQHGISATSELQTHQGRSPRSETNASTTPDTASASARLGTSPHVNWGVWERKKKTREGFTENENRNYLRNRNLVQTEQNY